MGIICTIREARRHFRIKRRNIWESKINELAMNSKNKNSENLYRGMSKFKRCYQHRIT
jgi:hypothetical protein